MLTTFVTTIARVATTTTFTASASKFPKHLSSIFDCDNNFALTRKSRNFSTDQKSAPIKKKKTMSTKLTEDQRSQLLKPLLDAGWQMDPSGRDAIKKEFRFKDFNQAFGWMTQVALRADKVDHHPEWFNCYNRVDVLLSSHDVNGLSERDVRLANNMEQYFKRFED